MARALLLLLCLRREARAVIFFRDGHDIAARLKSSRRKMMQIPIPALILSILTIVSIAQVNAQTLQIPMQLVDAKGSAKPIGTITVRSSADGVTFAPDLEGLPPGVHGFHIHEKPSCDAAMDPAKGKVMPAQAAGGHLDPEKTSRHEGPTGLGHLGDLPALTVDGAGKATTPVAAPRLKVSDLSGHALMIHAGGDNYCDSPEKLGGGGERIACGVIQ
jgi:superoxide dismutase, Cu-Zn family